MRSFVQDEFQWILWFIPYNAPGVFQPRLEFLVLASQYRYLLSMLLTVKQRDDGIKLMGKEAIFMIFFQSNDYSWQKIPILA